MIGMAAAFPCCGGGISRPLALDPPPAYKPGLIWIFN